MKLPGSPNVHLTYCLNIHPGETWEQNFAAIREKALAVKGLVAPDKPFGLGLRLGNAAARQLAQPKTLAEFRAFLGANGLYVFTVNGFPYGNFHGAKVKSDVYRPDWRDAARLDYTKTLADVLAALLPDGVPGSISTVPLTYKNWATDTSDIEAMVRNLAECAIHLDGIRKRTGKDIALALEPEPDCLIEDTDETGAFLLNPMLELGVPHVYKKLAVTDDAAQELLLRHIGVCVDVCHLAVEFESPEQSIAVLVKAGLNVAKVQLSSALACKATPAALQKLREFCDPVYLHQVKVLTSDDRILSYEDLAEALDDREPNPDEEWRVHFHVPLYFAEYGELRSTHELYTKPLARLLKGGVTPHLEIETYTFDVLPEAARESDVVRSIAREYEWVLAYLGS
jgi:hypothetical protein